MKQLHHKCYVKYSQYCLTYYFEVFDFQRFRWASTDILIVHIPWCPAACPPRRTVAGVASQGTGRRRDPVHTWNRWYWGAFLKNPTDPAHRPSQNGLWPAVGESCYNNFHQQYRQCVFQLLIFWEYNVMQVKHIKFLLDSDNPFHIQVFNTGR